MFLYLSILFLISLSCSAKALTVQTKNGALSGTEIMTYQGRKIYAFLGIPYAKPPVGELRFKEPQPVENWYGVKPAHNFSNKCIQFKLHKYIPEPIVGEEDCLYLNIFTPSIYNSSKFNVIFYIHGGAFMFGAGDIFTPDYILDSQDFVYVSFNYRLGPFGFLSTEDDVVPGNNGMKDQVLALRWVHDNIEFFGGDKDKITIAGLSAGGASVHLHYLSPTSRGLFNKGISLSGTAFCPWVIAEKSRSKAQKLGNAVGCPVEDSKAMVKCLRLKDARTLLLRIEELFMPWNYNPFSPFGVVVEEFSSSAFLTENPWDLLSKGKVKDVPWLTSMTTEEGLYPAASFLTKKTFLEDLQDDWLNIAPYLLDYNNTLPQGDMNRVSEQIKTFYFEGKEISTCQRSLVKMISDRLFNVGIETAARLQASVSPSPVYFYSFAYIGKYSNSDDLCKCKDNLGSSHADDLYYLLKTPGISPLETEDDREMMKSMISIWTSFIQFGAPSVKSTIWPPVATDIADDGKLTFVTINSAQDIKLMSKEDQSNKKFWNSLPFEELWNAKKMYKRYYDEL